MGRPPGPPPTPTNIRLLRGEKRPSQINYQEPQPVQKNGIHPPDDLSDQAIVVWERLADQLIKAGVLSEWDIENYAEYCEAVVSAREAQAHLDEEGEVIDVPIHNREGRVAGYKQAINPWWKIRMESAKRMHDGAARFGLTPADRSRLIAHGKLKMNGKPGEEKKPNGEDLLSG